MKRIALLLLAVALCVGCATHYSITMMNGEVITALGKPKYDKENGVYSFKDTQGHTNHVIGGNVREIAPANMADTSAFTPQNGH